MTVTLAIDKMSTKDRLQAMECLWDSLIHDTNEVESPSWHEDILSSRRKRIESGNARFLTIEELKKRHRE
jgi:putative addiction module component (TIGR02574 family)